MLKRVLTFAREYAVLFSVIGYTVPTILATIAILESRKANELAKRQYEESLKPIFKSEFNHKGASIDVNEIKMFSLKDDALIQDMLILFPSDYPSSKYEKVIGDTWNTYYFQSGVTDIFDSLFSHFDFVSQQFNYYDYDWQYPLVIKYKYLQAGALKTYDALYSMHFKAYDSAKIKLKNLIFIKELQSNTSNYVCILDEYNNLYGLQKAIFVHSLKLDSLLSSDNRVRELNELVKVSDMFYIKFQLPDNNEMQELVLGYPKFYIDSVKKEYIFQSLNKLIKDKSDKPIGGMAARVKQFLDANPACPPNDINCVKQSPWRYELKTISEWHDLMDSIKIVMYNLIKKE